MSTVPEYTVGETIAIPRKSRGFSSSLFPSATHHFYTVDRLTPTQAVLKPKGAGSEIRVTIATNRIVGDDWRYVSPVRATVEFVESVEADFKAQSERFNAHNALSKAMEAMHRQSRTLETAQMQAITQAINTALDLE